MTIETELTRHGLVIHKKDISESKLKNIIQELTVKPLSFNDDAKPYKLYKENTDTICVPRYYGTKIFGKPTKICMKSEKANIIFKGELREYQNNIIDKCIPEIKQNGGGLISIGCGGGKTVLALKIASMLGLKTLIVVHKTCLYDQWIERANQFCPDSKIGIIRQNKIQVEGYDMVIGTIQSISMKDYDPKIFQGFGLVIYDEAHTCPSRVFSNALYKTGGKYTLALTATPNRVDGLGKILHWYLGDTIFKGKRKIDHNVISKVFNYHSTDKLFTEKKSWNMKQKKMCPSMPKMITNLSKINQRTQHIINMINEIRKDPMRKILILSHRLDHLDVLKKAVDKSIKNDIEKGIMDENECRTAYYNGKLKKDERKYAEDSGDIIFATCQIANVGLDIARLNTVILATPQKEVTQAVGRIMRKVLENGDIRPLIVDFSDMLSIFRRHSVDRVTGYKKSKYKVENYYLYNDKIVNNKEYDELINGIDNNDPKDDIEYNQKQLKLKNNKNKIVRKEEQIDVKTMETIFIIDKVGNDINEDIEIIEIGDDDTNDDSDDDPENDEEENDGVKKVGCKDFGEYLF
jgi:superfamily II DNA or RNA helicase